MADVLVLAYAGCSTCKKALKWLEGRGVSVRVRPIVEEPPTAAELARWIPASGVDVRKWLNTSGQSYRAMGKAKVDASSDAELRAALAADGKLVKRPVLVAAGRGKGKEAGETVLIGFKPEQYEALFPR